MTSGMPIDKLFVGLISLVGVIFTYWFFLAKKDDQVLAKNNNIDITVEGGYQPASIVVPLGKTTRINFYRKDPSTCLEEVILGDFKIRKFLPLNESTALEITPQQKGKFSFSCGMGMFHGKLIVK